VYSRTKPLKSNNRAGKKGRAKSTQSIGGKGLREKRGGNFFLKETVPGLFSRGSLQDEERGLEIEQSALKLEHRSYQKGSGWKGWRGESLRTVLGGHLRDPTEGRKSVKRTGKWRLKKVFAMPYL